MFGIFKKIMDFFSGPPLKVQFEDMVLQDAAKKSEPVSKQEADGTLTILAEPVHGSHAKPVDDQITDAVTTKPKKARATKVKEEEGNKAPEKKPRAPRKKKAE